jgi:hypothetical protein
MHFATTDRSGDCYGRATLNATTAQGVRAGLGCVANRAADLLQPLRFWHR